MRSNRILSVRIRKKRKQQNPKPKFIIQCLFFTSAPPYCLYRTSWWYSGKESACHCRRRRRCGFDPWVRKIPWRRKCQPTLVFLPEESHGQRSLVGYSPWGYKELDAPGHVCAHTHTHTHTHTSWAIIKTLRTGFCYYLLAKEVKTQLLWRSVLFFLKWIILIGRFLNTLLA